MAERRFRACIREHLSRTKGDGVKRLPKLRLCVSIAWPGPSRVRSNMLCILLDCRASDNLDTLVSPTKRLLRIR